MVYRLCTPVFVEFKINARCPSMHKPNKCNMSLSESPILFIVGGSKKPWLGNLWVSFFIIRTQLHHMARLPKIQRERAIGMLTDGMSQRRAAQALGVHAPYPGFGGAIMTWQNDRPTTCPKISTTRYYSSAGPPHSAATLEESVPP